METEVRQLAALPNGYSVRGTYLLRSKVVRQASNGAQYLDLTLADRRREVVTARKWAPAPSDAAGCEAGDLVDVVAVVDRWRGAVQLKIDRLEPCADPSTSLLDYLPRAQTDPEEMGAELEGMIAGLTDAHLQRLLREVFDSQRLAAFKVAPASKSLHQAWVGGLIEHSLAVARLSLKLADLYPLLNGDLLVGGALCHDVGKLVELCPRSFAYTPEGKLLGHTALGLLLVEEALAKLPDFPPPLRLQFLHLLATHHGEPQFGATTRPATLEAWALHLADLLDSRLSSLAESVSGLADEEWTWNQIVGAAVWKAPPTRPPAAGGKVLREAPDLEGLPLFWTPPD